jgi:hypothetical protein
MGCPEANELHHIFGLPGNAISNRPAEGLTDTRLHNLLSSRVSK